MMRQRKRPLRLNRSNVVGIVDSQAGVRLLQKIPAGVIDAVELRLDLLGEAPGIEFLRSLPMPLLATARRPEEGGSRSLSDADRQALYERVMDAVQAVDVELAAVRPMAPVLDLARRAGRRVVLSMHDFEAAPTAARARGLLRRAVDEGADIFKIAVTPRGPADVGMLLELLEAPPIPVAAMGMGRYGRVSRLALAACGSVLNYGWLDRPVVAGQWPARELRPRLDELMAR